MSGSGLVDLLGLAAAKISAGSFPESERQVYFPFQGKPKVMFVKDIETLEVLRSTDEMPGFEMNEAERAVHEIEKTKVRHNGVQFLATGMKYDPDSNTISIQAKKTDYAFVQALKKESFPAGSSYRNMLFHTLGVRSPFLTKDGYFALMKRAGHTPVYSVAAGSFQPSGDLTNNPVVRQAVTEAMEEFLVPGRAGLEGGALEAFLDRGFWPYFKEWPSIAGVAVRHNGRRVEIEFIVPAELAWDSAKLTKRLDAHDAKDAREHVPSDFLFVPFKMPDTGATFEYCSLVSGGAGDFVLPPLMLSALQRHKGRNTGVLPTEIAPFKTVCLDPAALPASLGGSDEPTT